jgi:4-hydroxy-4-methyl-2-oxoglutarate aldolase
MIEDPPMIRRKQKIARPSTSQIEAFSGIPTGFVADALGGRGAMAPAIKPVVPEQAIFCGVALPVHCGPADNLAVMMSLPHVQ